jgi:hypothetical protein
VRASGCIKAHGRACQKTQGPPARQAVSPRGPHFDRHRSALLISHHDGNAAWQWQKGDARLIYRYPDAACPQLLHEIHARARGSLEAFEASVGDALPAGLCVFPVVWLCQMCISKASEDAQDIEDANVATHDDCPRRVRHVFVELSAGRGRGRVQWRQGLIGFVLPVAKGAPDDLPRAVIVRLFERIEAATEVDASVRRGLEQEGAAMAIEVFLKGRDVDGKRARLQGVTLARRDRGVGLRGLAWGCSMLGTLLLKRTRTTDRGDHVLARADAAVAPTTARAEGMPPHLQQESAMRSGRTSRQRPQARRTQARSCPCRGRSWCVSSEEADGG